jgi:hypothetical protein
LVRAGTHIAHEQQQILETLCSVFENFHIPLPLLAMMATYVPVKRLFPLWINSWLKPDAPYRQAFRWRDYKTLVFTFPRENDRLFLGYMVLGGYTQMHLLRIHGRPSACPSLRESVEGMGGRNIVPVWSDRTGFEMEGGHTCIDLWSCRPEYEPDCGQHRSYTYDRVIRCLFRKSCSCSKCKKAPSLVLTCRDETGAISVNHQPFRSRFPIGQISMRLSVENLHRDCVVTCL